MIFPSGPIALRTALLSDFSEDGDATSSQIVQSSLVTADPVTGTFSDLTLACPRLNSYHEIMKLFWTFPAITGAQLMVIWQVSLPLRVRLSQVLLYVKPSAGGSANSTVTIFTATLPFVPKVRTFLADVPKTTSPIGTGFGVVVRGISPSIVENSIF